MEPHRRGGSRPQVAIPCTNSMILKMAILKVYVLYVECFLFKAGFWNSIKRCSVSTWGSGSCDFPCVCVSHGTWKTHLTKWKQSEGNRHDDGCTHLLHLAFVCLCVRVCVADCCWWCGLTTIIDLVKLKQEKRVPQPYHSFTQIFWRR